MADTPFPDNILDELQVTMAEYMTEFAILRRPLRHTDPAQSLGIFAADWTPNQDTIQMGPQREPVVATYDLRIQLLIKATDEVTGRSMFGLSSKTLRAILYRDPDLVVRLTALTETILGTRETVKKFGVRRQRFLNNELQGRLMWLATTDLWLETESLKL